MIFRLLLSLALLQTPLGGSGHGGGGGTPGTFAQKWFNSTFFGSSTTTVTATVATSNLTAGSTIVGFIQRTGSANTLNSVSGAGGTCAIYNSGTAIVGNSIGYGYYAFRCYNVTGGSKPTITATFSGSQNVWWISMEEVTGLTTTDPLDCQAMVANTFTASGTNNITGSACTSSNSQGYVFAAMADDGRNGGTVTAGTTPITFTLRNLDNTNSESQAIQDGVQVGSGSINTAFSNTSSSVPVVYLMVLKHI